LIQRAMRAQKKAKADVVVANRLEPYRAFIIDKNGCRVAARNKNDLARKLLGLL